MRKKLINITIGLALTGLTTQAFAENLMQVYCDGVKNDPTFQHARAVRLANREALPQGIANLLPLIGFVGTTQGNDQRVDFNGRAGTTKFNSKAYGLQLTQPLFNFANWWTVIQADSTVKSADATYAAAAQDLMVRVATAYFKVLQAQDNLLFIQAQKASTARQLLQAQQRFEVGLEAITTVYNAQASYDLNVAQEIAAKNTIENNLEALRQITGCYYDHLAELKGAVPLIRPCPDSSDAWVESANKYNFNLLAARYTADAARAAVKVNFGGHLPVLSAVGSIQQANGFTTSSLAAGPATGVSIGNSLAGLGGSTSVKNSAVGLLLTVPIYQGGLVLSQTRQAKYNYEAAAANMDTTYRNVVSSTRQQFNNVIAGISQIQADNQAVKSNSSSLASTEESFKVGTRTIVDVLIAQQNLLQAQQTYSSDQYSYIINTINLKQFAGTLSEDDLMKINTWLRDESDNNSGYAKRILQEATVDVNNPPPLYTKKSRKHGVKPKKIRYPLTHRTPAKNQQYVHNQKLLSKKKHHVA